MKKEIKYTLVSFPTVFLLFVIFSVAISLKIFILYGGCSEAAPFSTMHQCTITEFIGVSFLNGYVLSIYLFPVYIVIPLVTYFITKWLRIKKESQNIVSDSILLTHNKKKKFIKFFVVTLVIIFVLNFWLNAQGSSIMKIIINIFKSDNKEYISEPEVKNLEPIALFENWSTYKSNYGYKIYFPPNYRLVYDGYEGPNSNSLKQAVFTSATPGTWEPDSRLSNFIVTFFRDYSEYESYKNEFEKGYFRPLPYHKIFEGGKANINGGEYLYMIQFPDKFKKEDISAEEQKIIDTFYIDDMFFSVDSIVD
ncbi:MAG: hypothetical protein AAB350_00545 [Patescibacteria group bacterium]